MTAVEATVLFAPLDTEKIGHPAKLLGMNDVGPMVAVEISIAKLPVVTFGVSSTGGVFRPFVLYGDPMTFAKPLTTM